MPIVALQRRLREAGRIRIGVKKKKDGKEYPAKLSTFRLTSRQREPLDAAAALYGGAVVEWVAPSGPQWELITEVKSLPVVVPPGDIAISQWLELWSGGGCLRRCDGQRELIGDQPCVCLANDKDECSPHTRLSVMLRDLPGLGVWRLDTQGWNAATELGGAVDVCLAAIARGRLLPATLLLELREQRTPGQAVKKFAVPVLDVGVKLDQLGLVMGTNGGAPLPALDAPDADLRALGTPGFTPVPVQELPPAPAPSVRDQLAQVGQPAGRPRANAQAPLPRTGVSPRGATVPAADASVGGERDGDTGSAPAAVGEASVSSSAPVTPVETVNDEGAQTIGRWCSDVGFGEGLRPAFLFAFSSGEYHRAHDVPVDDLARLRATLEAIRNGELLLDEGDGSLEYKPRLVSADDAEDRQVIDTPDISTAAAPGEVKWRAVLSGYKGIGQVKLLRRARTLAQEQGITPPQSLDDIPAALSDELRRWLDDQASAA